MNIEAFLLCDSATNQQGKWNILGIVDTIFSTKVPLRYPDCVVAIRIRFEKVEEGNHRITIHIIDEDGKLICPKSDTTVSVKVPNKLNSTREHFTVSLSGLNFAKYGKYRIDLAIDGRIEGSLPLDVLQMSEQL